MERSIVRLAPFAGLLFVVLVVASFIVEGSSPASGDPVDEIVDFYADNETRVEVASALAALGAISLLVFAARVSASMRRAGSTALHVVAVAGGAVAAAGIGVDSALRYGVAQAAGEAPDDATVGVFEVWSNFFWPMHLGVATLMLAVAIWALDQRTLPSWLAGIGVVASILVLVPVEATLIAGIIGVALWFVVSGVYFHREPLPDA